MPLLWLLLSCQYDTNQPMTAGSCGVLQVEPMLITVPKANPNLHWGFTSRKHPPNSKAEDLCNLCGKRGSPLPISQPVPREGPAAGLPRNVAAREGFNTDSVCTGEDLAGGSGRYWQDKGTSLEDKGYQQSLAQCNLAGSPLEGSVGSLFLRDQEF